jgi:hypothetical protein
MTVPVHARAVSLNDELGDHPSANKLTVRAHTLLSMGTRFRLFA